MQQSFLTRYSAMKREKLRYEWAKAKRMKTCYLFLLPYALLFLTFFILPIATSIYYSFTYYNILEPPRFIGFQNYINLILQDEVFLTAVRNTFVIAVITGRIYLGSSSHRMGASMRPNCSRKELR